MPPPSYSGDSSFSAGLMSSHSGPMPYSYAHPDDFADIRPGRDQPWMQRGYPQSPSHFPHGPAPPMGPSNMVGNYPGSAMYQRNQQNQ